MRKLQGATASILQAKPCGRLHFPNSCCRHDAHVHIIARATYELAATFELAAFEVCHYIHKLPSTLCVDSVHPSLLRANSLGVGAYSPANCGASTRVWFVGTSRILMACCSKSWPTHAASSLLDIQKLRDFRDADALSLPESRWLVELEPHFNRLQSVCIHAYGQRQLQVLLSRRLLCLPAISTSQCIHGQCKKHVLK